MIGLSNIASRMIEFHRFGRPEAIFSPDSKYIRTTGWDDPAREVSPSFNYETLLENLNLLRYEDVGNDEEVRAAREALADEAARLLPPTTVGDKELLQIDIVTNAGELWAFPFEAAFARNTDWLQHTNRGVVLTRRIRSEFSVETVPWPARPVVLFAHAPAAADLSQSLIDQHVEVLSRALVPWSRGKDAQAAGLLVVREVLSTADLASQRAKHPAAYVHLLAHGALVPASRRLPQKEVWGLRLGYETEPGTAPAAIAGALEPKDGLPLVVTLAACDSANQSSPAFAIHSVVQDLHRAGIPVVVGSQLPLTQPGSVVLTGAFYECLLQGDDVRAALHSGRVALFKDEKAGHDWLSLVGYVRLPPEGYAQHLLEFGLRAELGMLDAAQQRADQLSIQGGTLAEFADVETLVRNRLASLDVRRCALAKRRDLLDECNGLQASAFKRLAELLLTRARQHTGGSAKDLLDSKLALAQSAEHYRQAYRANVNSHWLGIQQLALEAALKSRFERPADLGIVTYVAELSRDADPDRGRPKDYWSCGTLAEAWLLAPVADQPKNLEAARAAATLLVERARAAKDAFAIESTRRQFRRYVTWWTSANGFFPGRQDLSTDAEQIIALLD
jgi:CHAT domain